MLLIAGKLKPNIRQYYRVWLFLAFLFPVAWFTNKKLGTNFLFLNIPSKDSPLVFLYQMTGKKWYLPGYAIMVAVINLIMYLPFVVPEIRSYFLKRKVGN
jgi:uncharacterized membrane protein YwaF